MLEHYYREWRIRNTLRTLAQQRVALVLSPGNVQVVEFALDSTDEQTDLDLRTCLIRGWVDVLHDAVRQGTLTQEGNLPDPLYTDVATIYRITDSGWSVIRRDRLWASAALVFAAASFLLSLYVVFKK